MLMFFWVNFLCLDKKIDLLYFKSVLFNNPSYSRILIGSHLWSIRGQMHDWGHRLKGFPLCFKVEESFENLVDILH